MLGGKFHRQSSLIIFLVWPSPPAAGTVRVVWGCTHYGRALTRGHMHWHPAGSVVGGIFLPALLVSFSDSSPTDTCPGTEDSATHIKGSSIPGASTGWGCPWCQGQLKLRRGQSTEVPQHSPSLPAGQGFPPSPCPNAHFRG